MSERLDRPVYIPCECRTPYHFLLIEPDEDMPHQLNVSFVSTRNGSIWHRIKWAMKHVLGREDLTFADIIIKRQWLENVVSTPSPDHRETGNG